MSDSVTIKIDGLDELITKLDKMGQEVAAKNIVAGAFNANKIVVTGIQEQLAINESVDTGLLSSSITRKRIVYDKQGTVLILTGVNKATKGVDSKGKSRTPRYYAHIVEKHKPFMRPSFQVTGPLAVADFISYLQKKIAKFYKT